MTDSVSTEDSSMRKLKVQITPPELPDFAPESFSIENLGTNVVNEQVVQKMRKFSPEGEKLVLSNHVEEKQILPKKV